MPEPLPQYLPGRWTEHRHGTSEPGWIEHDHLGGGVAHEHDPETGLQVRPPDRREPYGEIVRNTWVDWAKEQDDPKPSWLVGWADLDAGQREVDMRIGSAVAAAERARITGPVAVQAAAAAIHFVRHESPVVLCPDCLYLAQRALDTAKAVSP